MEMVFFLFFENPIMLDYTMMSEQHAEEACVSYEGERQTGLGTQQAQRDGRDGGHCLFVPALHTNDCGGKGFQLEIQATSTFGDIRHSIRLISYIRPRKWGTECEVKMTGQSQGGWIAHPLVSVLQLAEPFTLRRSWSLCWDKNTNNTLYTIVFLQYF